MKSSAVTTKSARAPDFESRWEFVSVDLFHRAQAEARLAALTGIVHIFYCGYQAREVWAD